MNSIGSSVKKSARDLAKASAKQVLKEPLEILSSVGKQVVGTETGGQNVPQENQSSGAFESQVGPQKEEEIKAKSKRLIEALEQELEDIKRQKEMEEQGKLQEEIVEARQEAEEEQAQPLIEPVTTRKKHQMPGMAGKLDKLKKKAEIRMPPSG